MVLHSHVATGELADWMNDRLKAVYRVFDADSGYEARHVLSVLAAACEQILVSTAVNYTEKEAYELLDWLINRMQEMTPKQMAHAVSMKMLEKEGEA